MTQINEPQEGGAPAENPSAATPPVPATEAQWLEIYNGSGTTVMTVLLRGECVTRLLVFTEAVVPISKAVDALKRWNTDPRRHFELDVDQWVKTYWEGTQPRYETTVLTTFRDLEWTVVDTEPGMTVSAVEVDGCVTRVRVDWTPDADLELKEADTTLLVVFALDEWNTVPGRQFQVDADEWTETEDGDNQQFETTVETTFQTVLELYLDTPKPLLPDQLVLKTVTLLSQQLPDYGVGYTSLFGSLQRAEHSPFARVTRTYIDNGEYFLEPENGWAAQPTHQIPLPLGTLEPVLQAFEDRLAEQEMTLNRKRHDDLLSLRQVYQAIAQAQGVTLAVVNSKRGRYLPLAYVQGTPEPPEEVLEVAPTESLQPEVTVADKTDVELWQSAAAHLGTLTAPAPELLAAASEVQPAHRPQVNCAETKAYLNLQRAVATLVESLKTYEDRPFSASKEGVTQQTAEEVAAYLMHTLLFNPSGVPGVAINGAVVQVAIDSVVGYYEAQYDSIVESREAGASAMHSEEPYRTEP